MTAFLPRRRFLKVPFMSRRLLAWILASVCVVSLSIWYPRPPEPMTPVDVTPIATLPLDAQSNRVDYNRDILPILSSKCFNCHGPDANARKSGVRLDLREAAVKPTKSGDVPIKPGHADQSEAMRRILSDDDSERMPPAKTGKSLTPHEMDLVKRWIDEGAEYAPHWAFVKPRRPADPEVKNKGWVKNVIDAFVLHHLEQAGLEPSPPADPITLIRRLSLDLTGLPPSIDEVDRFLHDYNSALSTQHSALERLVDRLLASPHYGEKMAQTWLDLARFGDTSGYHMDSTRQMSLWRDWVIDAFNKNMPFDQFTIEQLAGDLLPNATTSQKIASGFNRNTRFNEEGGVDPEEYVIRYNIDRTNTLGQVWLGLTLGCAECHSHKSDPISHQEYYQLFAYFTGIKEPMKEGHDIHGKPLPPLLKLPTADQGKELEQLSGQRAAFEKAIAKELGRHIYIDPLDGTSATAGPERSQIAWERVTGENANLPAEVRAALKLTRGERSTDQKKLLRDYYLRKINQAAHAIFGGLDDEIEQITRSIKAIEDAIPYTLISEEMPNPRPAFILIRGDFQQKGPRVERGLPAVFPQMPTGAPNNRLGLARWLVSPEHPLTARVVVNRLWAQMFGNGIVRSLGDFGTQGDYPSHPELLDWLASEFLLPSPSGRGAGGEDESHRSWDTKRLLRMIALSATYQQSSTFRADAAKSDPTNRLLSHAPRHRLTAEEIRDSALAISGLLNKRIGGPSFMPYQPPDFYRNKNEGWPWTPSAGDEQYRRGLYAFWRRTALHPMFVIFDAPSREECNVHRARTNTPQQALVTLNDATFVEAARAFAQRILVQGPTDLDGRLVFAFRSATCRAPSDVEMRVLRRRVQQQLDRFKVDRDAASTLVNVGQYPRDASLEVVELAAWTALANMLLNLDEVLMRE
jgi:hypothetical protein